MTLVVLHKSASLLSCFSDSRVSHTPDDKIEVISDHFPKLMLVPYCFTTVINGIAQTETKGIVGFAFSGGVLFASGVYALLANTLQNGFIGPGDAMPTLAEIANFASRIANIYREDDIFNFKHREFSVAIYGICPCSGEIQAYYVKPTPRGDRLEFSASRINFDESEVFSFGSAAESFRMAWRQSGSPTKENQLYHLIRSLLLANGDMTIGGEIQFCSVDGHGPRILSILRTEEQSDIAEALVSGIRISELGAVGRAKIGVYAVHFSRPEGRPFQEGDLLHSDM